MKSNCRQEAPRECPLPSMRTSRFALYLEVEEYFMKFVYGVFLLVVPCGAFPDQQTPPSKPQQPAATSTPQAQESPTQELNNRFEKQIAERIAGREKDPAGKVFKNIQIPWFKAVPAENFISIMNMGYSRALGVACTHCHVEQDFASDTKRPKRAGRESERVSS